MTYGELDPKPQQQDEPAGEEANVGSSGFDSTLEHTNELTRTEKRSALLESGFRDAGIDYMWLALGDEFYTPSLTPESAAVLIYERAGSPAAPDGKFDPIKRLIQVLKGVFNQDIAASDRVPVDSVQIWNSQLSRMAQQASAEN